MATLRSAAPPIASIFRFASQPTTGRRCAQCLKAQRCPFSSFRPRAASSKRPLMTESAHRPQSLEPQMPPPKNSGAPDTSISASQHQTWPPTGPWERKDGGSALSEREGEAQKSKPTLASTTGQQTAKPSITPEAAATKPKKSKLRPRKAPIVLTPKAVEQLRGLFDQPEHKMIRVGVKNRGCSGLAYHLEYVDKPGAFDETVEQDGVKVLIDSKALFSIIGSEMDWLEDKLSARFIFKNPNITEQCGCGESFSIS
ncbi:Iron-sulfur assembly protein 1 [Fulvia fulva]|uniref:Iron-sulfur assembly protein 1 n=1 Tax=Passalora fulva TaxID=5499 RepID=A0A9Q8L749_PASFU|nr:Iron-sulfur assembly protein 1 [Fulvia fulva]KAK4635041.1 Iron-sulfur assembly protein 1 [Fulvia fulva]KAK4636545.1 Iron-sulfur assembly protein 1 [Fulvia fulva]UJO11438.1 Iron-sulfur assembly protein 1 [Fulvia fulva]WPV09410.1 Iron-sulfur assembly protein 1 [Fulvia fulva]WPV23813.1 Iron-sulfur assembly protein 1 [Fulvia fulva]